MDTSDSECFESADEDVPTDGENYNEKENIKLNDEISSKKESKTIQDIESSSDNVLISDVSNLQIRDENMDNLNRNECENESKSKTSCGEVICEPMKHESNRKMKSKLGTKISKEHLNSDSSEVVKKEQKQEIASIPDSSANQSKDDENLWEEDELNWQVESEITNLDEENKSIENKLKSQPQQSRDIWSGFGNWGASVLTSATQSVTSITSQITNVIETGLGAIDPEDLARIDKEEKMKRSNSEEKGAKENDEKNEVGFGLGNLVKLVENTGSKVISGGLDTLETIGKKTMEVLQEGDPGLKKKRAFLKMDQNKPVLSQILREAKDKAENEAKNSSEKMRQKVKNYETLFDDHHGLVHLEALELLSKQCEFKLKNIQNSDKNNTDFLETMDQIKELCDLPDEDDVDEQFSLDDIRGKLEKAVDEMNIQINYEKLVSNWEETEVWLETINLEICDEQELHEQAIETLAQVTSMAMEQFHKIGELLLIKERRSTADEADSLVMITTTLVFLISIVAKKFSEKLNEKNSQCSSKNISELITNVYFEAANSSTYIKDALQLLIPVLQVGAI